MKEKTYRELKRLLPSMILLLIGLSGIINNWNNLGIRILCIFLAIVGGALSVWYTRGVYDSYKK